MPENVRCACCGSVLDVVFSRKKLAFLSEHKYNQPGFKVTVDSIPEKVYEVGSVEWHEFGWLHHLKEA